ncbi:MAG: hypothetical protein ACF8MF_10510 [Phycisphaerales bacterium JB052]
MSNANINKPAGESLVWKITLVVIPVAISTIVLFAIRHMDRAEAARQRADDKRYVYLVGQREFNRRLVDDFRHISMMFIFESMADHRHAGKPRPLVDRDDVLSRQTQQVYAEMTSLLESLESRLAPESPLCTEIEDFQTRAKKWKVNPWQSSDDGFHTDRLELVEELEEWANSEQELED